MRPDAKVKVENIPLFLGKQNNKCKFIPGKNPMFVYRYKKQGMVEKDEELLLQMTEKLLSEMRECLWDEEI